MGPQSASSRGRMNGTVRRACQAFRCARGAHPVEMKRAALPPPRPARRHPPSTSTRLRPRRLRRRSPAPPAGAADLVHLVAGCACGSRGRSVATDFDAGIHIRALHFTPTC